MKCKKIKKTSFYLLLNYLYSYVIEISLSVKLNIKINNDTVITENNVSYEIIEIKRHKKDYASEVLCYTEKLNG